MIQDRAWTESPSLLQAYIHLNHSVGTFTTLTIRFASRIGMKNDFLCGLWEKKKDEFQLFRRRKSKIAFECQISACARRCKTDEKSDRLTSYEGALWSIKINMPFQPCWSCLCILIFIKTVYLLFGMASAATAAKCRHINGQDSV